METKGEVEDKSGNASHVQARTTIQASPCWARGKELFFLSLLESKRPPSKGEIDDFMKDNAHLDGTIQDCQKIQKNADASYKEKASGRLIGKLLNTLSIIKEVADPFLEFAPESVSIAWFAISALVQIGATDVENCELIFGACNNVATILLTCRLYENRYQNSPKDGTRNVEIGSREVEQKIIGGIPDVIASILDFSWHVRLLFKKNKFVRALKEAFSPKIKEKIDAIDAGYAKLRQIANDAFQERIMDSVEDLRKSLQQDRDELRSIMFPALDEISEKLNEISDVKANVELTRLREEFRLKRTEYLRPTETHVQQFNATFDPVSKYADHICQWLFSDIHYKLWELHDDDIEQKETLHSQLLDIHSETDKTAQLKIPNLFYIQARPGFGKSVTMASVIRKLSLEPNCIVAYFFFKQGDDNTQKSLRALNSLAAQLFDDKNARTVEEILKLTSVLDQMKKKVQVSPREGDDARSVGSVAFTIDMLKETIRSIGNAIERRIYIVVDGMDECIDYEWEDLVPYLIDLSKLENFRVIISSRESEELESLFTDDDESDSDTSSTTEDTETTEKPPPDCILAQKATILNITQERNSTDMEIYLRKSLERIMNHRSRSTRASNTKSEKDASRVAKIIKRKANGMFTYAAIVIASLEQPSQLTLFQKLKNLPEGMDDLYRQRLEDLNHEEQRLVLTALKFVVWGFGGITTVEIAEHFKKIYHDSPKGVDDKLLEDEDESEDEAEEESTTTGDNANTEEGGLPAVNESTEGVDEKSEDYDAMDDPEIAETVYHLTRCGRDFFKFSNNQTDIDVVHKTVRDWVQNEAERMSKWYEKSDASRPQVTVNEKGELNVTLPIPPGLISGGRGVSIELQSERDAQLDLTTDILGSLCNDKFIERYMGFGVDIPGEAGKEEKKSEEGPNVSTSVPVAPLADNTLKEPTASAESEEQSPDGEENQPSVEIREPAPKDLEGEEDGPKGKEEELRPGVEAKRSFSFAAYEVEEKEFRYESAFLIDHLKRVEELWPKDDRKGSKWEAFWENLRKFFEGKAFRHWLSQYFQFWEGYSPDLAYDQAFKFEALHIFAGEGCAMVVEFLLVDLKVDPNILDSDQRTAFNFTFAETACMKLLLKHGLKIDQKYRGKSYWELIITDLWLDGWLHGNIPPKPEMAEICKIFIDSGADINEQMPILGPTDHSDALHCAVASKSLALFDVLMAHPDVKVNSKDRHDMTPLNWMNFSPNSNYPLEISKVMTQRLLEAGADPNNQDSNSGGPLLFAVSLQDKDVVELLLKHGADVNDDNNQGLTSLHFAASAANKVDRGPETSESILRLLLSYGADVEREAKDGETPLHRAAWSGYEKCFMILFQEYQKKKGPDKSFLLNSYGEENWTYFRNSARNRKGGMKIMKFLIQDWTPEQLQSMLANSNAKKETALHLAAFDGDLEMVKYLLELGGDATIKSEFGTVLDRAIWGWAKSKAEMAEYSEKTLQRQKDLENVIFFLIEKFPELCQGGGSNLRWAIKRYDEKLINKLVENGADIEWVDEEGWTIYEYAYAERRLADMQQLPGFTTWKENPNRSLRETMVPSRMAIKETPNIFVLSEDGLEFQTAEGFVDAYGFNYGKDTKAIQIRADHPTGAHRPIFYFEVTIQELEGSNSGFSIGFMAGGCNMRAPPGSGSAEGETFGLWGHGHIQATRNAKSVFHNVSTSAYITRVGLMSYDKGDTIGCGYAVEEGKIFYTLNGTYLGTAFEDVRGRLYPSFGSYNKCKGKVNFGTEPFLFEDLRE
ncbi:hypothetical protein TWF102_005959 [Orbilia oligospora]|uniref:B30.2/SPRY domain-containing protein n=1 Tax=Orbilia oligospora TaxID=2813651 RepID=A0A7C8N519_ORBOL|nr:hypothetical protein TWF102_005959 [Orbilia oligospora]KAF3108183.1 hypothetical protein TWF103_005731 [Orbilia oligospora]